MKRRILCFVLTMAMVLSMLVVVPATIASADSYDVSISTAAEFKAFRDAVNDGTYDSGVTAQLTADIDISDDNWTPIGNSTSHPFKGTFNGNGHTISGLIQTRGSTVLSSSNAGLFGYVSSVDGGTTTITNFKLTSSGTGITGRGSGGNVDVGTVVSQVRGSTTGIVTVNVTGVWSTVNLDASSAKAAGVGGIVGVIGWVGDALETRLYVDSCRYSGFLGSPSVGSNDYGGIVGWTRENNTPKSFYITNCLFDGVLSLYHTSPDDNGGIIGYLKGNTNSSKVIAHIENCIVAGQFQHPNKSGYAVTGYVLSEASGSNTDYQVTNVYYCDDADRHTGGDLGGWYGYYKKGDGAISSLITATNVTAKTMAELKALTSGFADDTKWHFGESSELPIPAMIYDNIIANQAPSIFDDLSQSEFTITSDEEMAEFQALVNAGTTFAGKTIKLGADVALNGRIGATSSLAFSGNFDGQGHTVTITQSISNPDGNGGLFDFVRIPENGTITIQNVHVTGTISLTNSANGKGYTGGLISSVDANTSGNGGTINIQNVWNTVRINGGTANAWNSLGGFIGFVRHADGLKQITINIDSCLWDGVINCGPAIYHAGGFIAYTGNNKADRQPTINITNSVAAGTIMANIDGWNQQFGVLTSYLKGSYSDDATAKVTVNIENVISLAKATFAKATGSGSTIGLIEQVDGTTELNLSNIYYKTFARTGVEGDFPVVASGEAHTTENVEEKTQAELLALSTSVFSDSTKWVKESNDHYPCPAGIVNVFGGTPDSLYVEPMEIFIGTDAAMANFADSINNGGKNYAGKTIHLTADVNLTTVIGDTNSAKYFSGNFNGHGHTVTITQTIANPDGNGGLFSMVRVPENSTLTIQDVHLAGTITLTNSSTSKGYVGALISCVDAGTSGSGGTLNVTNVWSTTRINAGASNTWYAISSYIGFVRHASGLKPLTINMDSCLWDGVLNFGPATEYCGSFVGYTGNQQSANRPLTLNITNSVVAGTMMLNAASSDDSGLLTGYLKGNGNNSATSAVTANFHDIVVTGKITSSVDLTVSKWNSSLFEVSGTTTVDMANFYYIPRNVRNKTLTVYEDSSSNPATVKPTGTATEKTGNEMYALSTSAFSDASKWSKQNSYYVCPTGIVETFGEIPASLLVDVYEISDEIEIGTVAEFIAFRDAVNGGNSMAGKTITLTADIDLAGEAWVGIGSRSAEKVFSGTFDGQGHTISNLTVAAATTETGALFCQAGNATIQNFTLTGTINVSGNANFMGSVINCVYGNTTLRNVRSLVNFKPAAEGQQFFYCGGLIGFIHNTNNADLTIDGCEYAGNINTSGQTNSVAGILGYTGWGNSGVTKTVTITNTFFTGSINFNDPQYYENNAGFIGYVNRADNGGTITVNISNSYSAGRLYFTRSKAWTAANNYKCAQLIGQVKAGVTLNIDSTVVYKEAYLYTQVENEKPVEDSKVILGEIGVFGSEYGYDTPAVVASMDVTFGKRDVDDQYKGIRFTATFTNVGACTGGGTASANFGIFLMTRETYEILGGVAVTKSQLVDNNSVVQVKATKFQNNTSSYVVNAVVFNLNTATRQATELVAIAYAGNDLGTAASTTYNALFN